ncbi:hypothetical protein D3C84_1234540 [compost metagenome]
MPFSISLMTVLMSRPTCIVNLRSLRVLDSPTFCSFMSLMSCRVRKVGSPLIRLASFAIKFKKRVACDSSPEEGMKSVLSGAW